MTEGTARVWRFGWTPALSIVAGLGLATAAPGQDRPTTTLYGTPGLIDMPTAESAPDGDLSVTLSRIGKTTKTSFTFQITPRLSGTFRYSIFDDFEPATYGTLYDRSFDLRYRLLDEGAWHPAVAIGLQDFGGTGVLGAEYIVATKHLGPVTASGGIGWGRLGSANGFDNPLALIFGDGFRTRPSNEQFDDTGKVGFDTFFHGDAALFGGLAWQVNDRLVVKAEYSPDAYDHEVRKSGFERKSPVNLGGVYRFRNGVDLGAYYLYGSTVGLTLSFTRNPKTMGLPGGREDGGPLVVPRDMAAAQSWGQPGGADLPSVRDRLRTGLAAEGIRLEALDIAGGTATVHIANETYGNDSEALGRTARLMTGAMPPGVSTFVIVPMANGIPVSAVTILRDDLEQLASRPDAVRSSRERAQIADGAGRGPAPGARDPEAYPMFDARLGAYAFPSYFDPDSPIRLEAGARLDLDYQPRPGLIFSASLKKPFYDTVSDSARLSNSVLPHVRTDDVLYARESDIAITHLTGEYFFRPGRNLYGRVTVGYLERMYGGISTELLWRPIDSRLALGAELNYAVKRDFDQLFGFQDYDIVTGHLSAYYDLGRGYQGQVDIGRYLAGDYGATVSLDREFGNGVRIGAFFTLTDVSAEDFGEGAFDKGLKVRIPLEVLTGKPTREVFSQEIHILQRDGGARLDVRNRLFDVTRGSNGRDLGDRWGRFWR